MITEEQYLEALNIIEAYEEQLRIANVSKSLLTCKCGKQVKDLNDGLCYPCWNERYEASKQCLLTWRSYQLSRLRSSNFP